MGNARGEAEREVTQAPKITPVLLADIVNNEFLVALLFN
jgi:hypothetical protein